MPNAKNETQADPVDANQELSRKAVPPASSRLSRHRMRSTPSRDTRFELRVRSALHKRGLRYRVNYSPLPGTRRTGDVVFVKARIAVMLDGCFWHRCPTHFKRPKTNVEFWEAKFARNRQRDKETTELLSEAGWLVLRFWEHQPTDYIVETVHKHLRHRLTGATD